MELSPGREGTRETLRLMHELTIAGKKSVRIRQLAVEITRGLKQKDWLNEVAAIHQFVRDNIRYIKDIRGVETLHTADRVLDNAAGDCDDKSVLAASLLESINHPTRFVAIGFRKGNFSHVFVETRIGSKWIAVETTEPVPVGWRPMGIVNSMVINN